MRQFLCFFCALLLASCSSSKVTVYNQTMDQKFLASTHAKTPDPRNTKEFIGQRLVVRTNVSKKELKKHDFVAKVYVQYGNRTQEVYTFDINKSSSDHIVTLMEEQFQKKRGIATYKVELLKDGQIDAIFEHQLWCPLIDLSG